MGTFLGLGSRTPHPGAGPQPRTEPGLGCEHLLRLRRALCLTLLDPLSELLLPWDPFPGSAVLAVPEGDQSP